MVEETLNEDIHQLNVCTQKKKERIDLEVQNSSHISAQVRPTQRIPETTQGRVSGHSVQIGGQRLFYRVLNIFLQRYAGHQPNEKMNH